MLLPSRIHLHTLLLQLFLGRYGIICGASSNGSVATSIYIDLVPGYANLSDCAEVPLSTMIRNMWNGCGDDSQLTSYSCFCTDSYSKFSWDISTAVLGSCGSPLAAQATSAVAVFHLYCASGTTQLTKSTAAPTITSPTSAPTTSMPRALGPIQTGALPGASQVSRTALGLSFYASVGATFAFVVF